MFLAAFASLRAPESKAFYDRKRTEGKKHNAAIICLARRRCDVIFACCAPPALPHPRRTRRPPSRSPPRRSRLNHLTTRWEHPPPGADVG
jgi:hypothetical protein